MMETVAIAGVGLIGGSFALALRAAGFRGRILGVSSERTIRRALELGVIDEGGTLEEACGQADLVYLAGPIHAILDTIPQLNAWLKPGALVTDAGSTKALICRTGSALTNAQFLGGHPMAGKELRGVEAAEAGLFRGRPYLLTPERLDDMDTPPAVEFVSWLRRIGSEPEVLSPQEHDSVVALSSHLPQLLSTALSSGLSRQQASATVAAAAGPGLVDSTRLAMSAWEIWRDILETNQPAILDAMDVFSAQWQELRQRLASTGVEEDFRQGREFAQSLRPRSQQRENGETKR
jgi:prephenate dehydrogenase